MRINKNLLITCGLMFGCFIQTQSYAQQLYKKKVIPHLSVSLIVPEVSYELPLNYKSTSLKLSVKPFPESLDNDISFYPGLGLEFRKYNKKEFTEGLFEGGYTNLFYTAFLQQSSTSHIYGLMYGHQNYFGKKNSMFYDLGGGLLRLTNDTHGIGNLGIYPGLQIRFGFRIM